VARGFALRDAAMKIAFLCNEYPPASGGGIGRVVSSLGALLCERGHDVTVIGLGERAETRKDGAVRIETLRETRLRGWSWWWDRRRVFQRVQRGVHAGEIELVDVPDYWGMLPFPLDSVPVVVRLHLTETALARAAGRAARRSAAWCERRTLRFHRTWLGVSHFAVNDTIATFGLRPEREQAIYNPVVDATATAVSMPALPADFVLFAGLVGQRKGAYLLAEAARRFLRTHPSLHLVYAGRLETIAGISADARIREILGAELGPRVHFTGVLPEPAQVRECMRRARAFVFPTTQEYLGLVAIEAMLAGCPTIVGDLPVSREFAEQGREALLVPPREPEAIAQAVSRVLAEPEWAATLARRGRDRARDQFDPARIAAQNAAFFEELRARHRGVSRASPTAN
jgi:glycosyltransferase involved in cell wall biosynthesis